MTNPTDFPPALAPLDATLRERLQHVIDHKTKPPGSLGQLEALALQVALIQRTERPQVQRPVTIVFAADHGIAAEGVSPYPQSVTAQMVANFLAGGAAINAFAGVAQSVLEIVDAGVASPLPASERLVSLPIARGTRNFALEPAMTLDEANAALAAGAARVPPARSARHERDRLRRDGDREHVVGRVPDEPPARRADRRVRRARHRPRRPGARPQARGARPRARAACACDRAARRARHVRRLRNRDDDRRVSGRRERADDDSRRRVHRDVRVARRGNASRPACAITACSRTRRTKPGIGACSSISARSRCSRSTCGSARARAPRSRCRWCARPPRS